MVTQLIIFQSDLSNHTRVDFLKIPKPLSGIKPAFCLTVCHAVKFANAKKKEVIVLAACTSDPPWQTWWSR